MIHKLLKFKLASAGFFVAERKMINRIYALFKSKDLHSLQYSPAGVNLESHESTYVTYFVVTDIPNNHLDSNFESSNVRVQFDIYSTKLSELDSVTSKLIDAIINEEGLINFVNDQPFSIETRRYRKTIDVSFFNN